VDSLGIPRLPVASPDIRRPADSLVIRRPDRSPAARRRPDRSPADSLVVSPRRAVTPVVFPSPSRASRLRADSRAAAEAAPRSLSIRTRRLSQRVRSK